MCGGKIKNVVEGIEMKRFCFVNMVLFFLVLAFISGCAQQEEASSEKTERDTKIESEGNNDSFEPYNFEEHLTISMLTTGSPIPYEGNPVFELIEEKFNVTFDIQYYDRGDFEEYLSTLAASGNLPDIWRFGHNDPRMFSDWAERGAYYDVKPLLQYHPDLEAEYPTWAWEILNPPGHYYGVPEYRLQTRNMLAIRQDWLDTLGLDVPDTIDEFYEVAHAFTHQDPNGTGKNDTIGFSAMGLFSEDGTAWRGGAFGLAREWKDIDGELVPYQAQLDELTEYISFMRKAYEEGVLDKDFMLHTDWRDANERLSNGIAGIEYVNPNSVHEKEAVDVKEHDPNAELTFFPPPAGPEGSRTTPTRSSFFKKVINANVSKEKAHRILAIYEWNITDGYEITRHGIEDIHYTVHEDGTVEKLDAWDEHEPASIGTNLIRGWNELHRAYWWLGEEFEQNLAAHYEMNEKYLWEDDNPALISETNVKIGGQLDAEFEQMMTEIVVGRRGMEDVETAVNRWLNDGGQKIIDEMNELYEEYKATRS